MGGSLTVVDGQLTSVRRVVVTVSDLNSAVMTKLGKVEGELEKLVDMNLRLEGRMDSMEKELVVSCQTLRKLIFDCPYWLWRFGCMEFSKLLTVGY